MKTQLTKFVRHNTQKNIPLLNTLLCSFFDANMSECFPKSHPNRTWSTVEKLSQNLQLSPLWPAGCSAPQDSRETKYNAV